MKEGERFPILTEHRNANFLLMSLCPLKDCFKILFSNMAFKLSSSIRLKKKVFVRQKHRNHDIAAVAVMGASFFLSWKFGFAA